LPIPIIAFDEAGNTGSNLLDQNQPCFSLTSVCLSEDDARKVLQPVSSTQANEVHFSKLKRRIDGREGIIAVLQSPLLKSSTAKIFVVNKRFMVVTKIVDLLIESLLYENGIDLYDRGGNIALANLLYYCTPTFCGSPDFERILDRFLKLVRKKSNSAITEFYGAVSDCRARCGKYQNFQEIFDILTATRTRVGDYLPEWSPTELDPALSTFMSLSSAWSDQLGEVFSVIHDDSKPIAFDKDLVEALMDSNGQDVRVGRDRRTGPLFIRATGITLVNSKDFAQVQVADLLAGASAYLFAGYERVAADSEFHKAVESSLPKELIYGAIWPAPEVDPEALETDSPFKGETEARIGHEIAKRVYFDDRGKPRRRA